MAKQVDWREVADSMMELTPNIFGIGIDLSKLVRSVQGGPVELEDKAQRAASALHEASSVVAELQSAVKDELHRVGSLKEEYKRYKSLASIEEEKAKALLRQLQDSLSHGRGRERWIALGINLAAGLIIFVIGVVLSPAVKQLLGVSS